MDHLPYLVDRPLDRHVHVLIIVVTHTDVIPDMENGNIYNSIRAELQQFASSSERLLGYGVKAEELTPMEAAFIQYYLSALAEKFPAKADRDIVS